MPSQSLPAIIPLAGFPILSTSSVKLKALLQERLESHRKTVLVFVNTNFVMKCQHLRTWLSSNDVVLVNDGLGVDIAALMVTGHKFQENLNGTDFSPFFLRDMAAPHKLYLIGGAPGIAELAGKAIERDYGQKVVGTLDGFTTIASNELNTRINASGADIILIALGNPLQEEWIYAHAPALHADLIIGVGALFDFISGSIRRAPHWMRVVRVEWLFRLLHEPGRLMRRYTIDIAVFLVLCLRNRRMSTRAALPERGHP